MGHEAFLNMQFFRGIFLWHHSSRHLRPSSSVFSTLEPTEYPHRCLNSQSTALVSRSILVLVGLFVYSNNRIPLLCSMNIFDLNLLTKWISNSPQSSLIILVTHYSSNCEVILVLEQQRTSHLVLEGSQLLQAMQRNVSHYIKFQYRATLS